MKFQILATVIVLATASSIAPALAQEPGTGTPAKSNEVLNACVENRAETLPNPFSDVPANHWAFKAVMTMHYCGAFRQATPRGLFQQLRPTESQPQPLTKPQESIKNKG